MSKNKRKGKTSPFTCLMRLFLMLILLTGLALWGGVAWVMHGLHSPANIEEPILYTIPKGASIKAVEQELYAQNILFSPYAFTLAMRLGSTPQPILAGEYELATKTTPTQMLELFQSGPNHYYALTIPEGRTSYEIVQILNAAETLQGPPIAAENLPAEGTLLPETYHTLSTQSRADLIKQMQAAMTKALDEAWENRAENLPLKTKEEALILASIIEKETALPDEHAKVAGVFMNRLRKGMALQTDPTVIYAINGGKHQNDGKGPLGRRLLRKDLEINSPYNTYLHAGLPPGPITNPGVKSIKAALNPEEHDYIYFVADGTGGHAFAKTLKEHNQNAAKWRKVRGK